MGSLLLSLVCAAALAVRQHPEAPDGHRGLGATTELAELQRVAASDEEEDLAFVASLLELEPALREQLGALLEVYERLGYTDLVETRDPDLAALHAAFLEARADPLPLLARGDRAAEALAAMLLDTRFLARVQVASGWEVEAREVRAGVGLLSGSTDGWVVLTPQEGAQIATRVDLSASLLRALQRDLDVLRPQKKERVDRAETERLLALARGDTAAAEARIDEAEAVAERMLSAMFSPRLRAQENVVAALQLRERIWARSAPLRKEALLYLPTSDEGRSAPPEVSEMRKHERIRRAGVRGQEGVAVDPLDEDLAYVLAHATNFLWGADRSRAVYDRYLALRGIRAHDYRTLKGRALTARENEALAVVQQAVLPGGMPGGR